MVEHFLAKEDVGGSNPLSRSTPRKTKEQASPEVWIENQAASRRKVRTLIYVAIAEHTPAQCLGSNEEVLAIVGQAMPKIPDLEQKHNVKNLGMHVMISSHKTVMILDAPSFEAAEMVLLESDLVKWNTVELSQAYTPEQAMALTMGTD